MSLINNTIIKECNCIDICISIGGISVSDYIDVEKKIYIPLKLVIVNFHEKEEVELNAFQRFILEAIEENATVEQMTDATQLTKNVIESEVLQMESQKLLVREGNSVVLSELSKNILMISRSVEMLNEEKKILCINLITGDIERYDKDIYYDTGQDGLVMEGKIRSEDVVGISIEDNVSFFVDYMSAFDKLSEEQIDKVLSSVYAEFNEIDKKIVYKQQDINKLPCLIGNGKLKLEDNAYAEGKCSVIMVEVSTDKVEKYKEQIKNIMVLYADTPELISDSGRDLVREYENCEDYNKEKLTFVYDHISGIIREEKYSIVDSSSKRAQLMLESEKKIDDEVEKQVFAATKTKWKLNEEYHIKIADIKERIYKIGFCLKELRGETYEDE